MSKTVFAFIVALGIGPAAAAWADQPPATAPAPATTPAPATAPAPATGPAATGNQASQGDQSRRQARKEKRRGNSNGQQPASSQPSN